MLVLGLVGFLFMAVLQPFEMIMFLVVGVIVGVVYMYYLLGSFWFGYLVMLVVVSGVLVVFMYMASLVPNESYEFFGFVFLVFVVFGLVCGGIDVGVGCIVSYISLKLWEDFFFFANLFMVVFLLMVMIVVVSISYIGVGPIRSV